MTIILDYNLPEKGPVTVNLAFEIKVTAEEARRKVNRWLILDVSTQMGARTPTLVVTGQRAAWRVPVWLSFPSTGPAGMVGEVDVDIETGEMLDLSDHKVEIEKRATEIASRLPPFKTKEVPPEYLAKNVPPAPEIVEEEES
jgi:hypothetical protein